jgi:ATP-dependent DNA helicase RecQ
MQEYVSLPFGSHMSYLISKLDGDVSRIAEPTLPPLTATVEPATLQKAEDFFTELVYPILPRKRWPTGGLARYGVSSTILSSQCAEVGRSLSEWGDSNWWQQITNGKYLQGHLPDTLLQPFANLIHDNFAENQITWMTCIPSLRRPDLLPDFMRRFSLKIGLAFLPIISATELRPEQKSMNNSYQQARNLDGAFEIVGEVPSGNVLLVDDMVDSGWTMTVAAYLLRKNGSGLVYPASLTMTSNG